MTTWYNFHYDNVTDNFFRMIVHACFEVGGNDSTQTLASWRASGCNHHLYMPRIYWEFWGCVWMIGLDPQKLNANQICSAKKHVWNVFFSFEKSEVPMLDSWVSVSRASPAHSRWTLRKSILSQPCKSQPALSKVKLMKRRSLTKAFVQTFFLNLNQI